MTHPTKRWAFAVSCSVFLFFAAVCLLQAPAMGQPNGGVPLKEAVSRLEQFQKDVEGMRSVVGKPLGPYPFHTKCTWCSERAWWGLGFCTKNTTETWNATVDFSWTRNRLDRVLKAAGQNASTFSSSYAPTQAWIEGLPQFSAKFDAAADTILGVQDAIKKGTGPSDQQRQIVTQALQGLTDDLGSSSAQLQKGTTALAAFLQQQSSYRDSIKQAIDGADRSAQEALTNLENQSKTHRCQGGLKEKFAAIKADFSRSIQQISGAFQKLDASSREAEKGLASLLGFVVSAQTDLQSVLEQVKAATKDKLGSFLERLHLTSAKKQWKDLADSAVALHK